MTTVKTAISVDPQLMKKVDVWAQELKISRSRLFAMGVENLIHQYESKQMLEAINKAYDDSATEEEAYLEAMVNEFGTLLADEEW